jgi:murein DD-endopeptidase MepM/ murein hydrolase activator NlpD
MAVANIAASILETSALRDQVFAATVSFTEIELKLLMALPSLVPIEQNEQTNFASGFGQRINPFHKGTYFHPGVDFAAPRGTSVFASGNGKVVNISRSSIQAGYGNYIEIDHGSEIVTLYAHLEEINVRIGQNVKKGFIIGTVGNSGGSVAPHLHFEIFRNGDHVNPIPYLMDGHSTTKYAELLAISNKKNQSLD